MTMLDGYASHYGIVRDGQQLPHKACHAVPLISTDPEFRAWIDRDGIVHASKDGYVDVIYRVAEAGDNCD